MGTVRLCRSTNKISSHLPSPVTRTDITMSPSLKQCGADPTYHPSMPVSCSPVLVRNGGITAPHCDSAGGA